MPFKLTEDRCRLALGTLLFVAGSAMFYMLPPYLAELGRRFSLDSAQLGTLAGVESAGIGLASLLGPLWIARLDHRATALMGVFVCFVGDGWTATCCDYHTVLWLRFGVGMLGEGMLLTISFSVLSRVRNVDRAFAIALTSVVAFGAAVIAFAGLLERVFPRLGPLAPLAAVALLPLLFARGFKQDSDTPATVDTPRRPPLADRPVIIALIAQALWFGAPGAFWTFAETVAINRGVAPDAAELALSMGELASLSGTLVAAWLGFRWGRRQPIVIASVGMLITCVFYAFSTLSMEIAMYLSLFYALWNYGTVYQMSLVSSLDTSGRLAVVMPAAQVFGLSIGPMCAGWWMNDIGDLAVTLCTFAFVGVSLALYWLNFHLMRRADGLAARAG
jgi:predicted MFS family arabinose efflux permease